MLLFGLDSNVLALGLVQGADQRLCLVQLSLHLERYVVVQVSRLFLVLEEESDQLTGTFSQHVDLLRYDDLLDLSALEDSDIVLDEVLRRFRGRCHAGSSSF